MICSTAHGLENAPAGHDHTLKCGDRGHFHEHAELSKGMGPEGQIPLAPYQGRGRYPALERGRVCLPLRALTEYVPPAEGQVMRSPPQ